MKKLGSLVLVLVMVLTAVSALAGDYPGVDAQLGDIGGKVSEWIASHNARGVPDGTDMSVHNWQKKPADGVSGTSFLNRSVQQVDSLGNAFDEWYTVAVWQKYARYDETAGKWIIRLQDAAGVVTSYTWEDFRDLMKDTLKQVSPVVVVGLN